MRPLRGERARGLAPSAGADEAGFRADSATVGWFDSSRQFHFRISPAHPLSAPPKVQSPASYEISTRILTYLHKKV